MLDPDLSDPRREPRRGKKLLWFLAIVVTLLVLGHLSNLVSLQSCEREVLRSYQRGLAGGRTLRFPEEDPSFCTDLRWRLEAAGVRYEALPAEEFDKDPYPTCGMKQAVPVCPFVVSIDFWGQYGPLGGIGGKAYVVNFFGLSKLVLIWPDWVS